MDDNTVNNNIEDRVNNTQETSVHTTPKELPISILRLEVQRTIEHYTETFQCSRDFVTSAVFCIVGTLCGKHVTVFDGVYRNHPNMWICHVGTSGSCKSHAVKRLLRPVLQENYRRCEGASDKHMGSTQGCGNTVAKENRLTVSDVTPEGLYQVLFWKSQSNDGLLLYRDEIRGFIDDIGRYHNSGEISNYLSIWDGTSFSVVRKTQTSMDVMDPFLSIMGGVQPTVLGKMFKTDRAEDGFVQRWLFVYPDAQKRPLYSKCPLDSKYEAIWNEIVSRLLKMEDMEFVLSEEAEQVYIDYFNDTILRADGADDYVSSLLAKLRIHVLKWCAVVHVLSCTEGAESFALPTSMVITAEEMQYSVECMRYFEYCGVKALKIILGDSLSPRLTKNQVIKELVSVFGKDNINISSLAEGIGTSRQYVSKIINNMK